MKNLSKIFYEHPRYAEFLKYCVVGIISTCTDCSIFYVVRMFTTYQKALVSGYILSLILNYLLTVYWTFSTHPSSTNLIGIIASHLFNLFVVRMSLMHIFIDVMQMPDNIAYIPTLLISIVTNFLIIRFVVHRF